MADVNVFLLHGFLGRPQDWKPVEGELAQEGRQIHIPDYFRIPLLSPLHSFTKWAQNFNQWAQQHMQASRKNILVGYSLGGRLALHALEQNPQQWDQVVLLSTNPGFNDKFETLDTKSEERVKRWVSDSQWAEDFMNGSWENVVKAWNAQSVFVGGRREPQRQEQEYSRDTLSLALTQWSLAQQKNLRPILRQYTDKVHWLVGEEDEKFFDAAQILREQIPQLQIQTFDSGHRIPFEVPQAVAGYLRNLL